MSLLFCECGRPAWRTQLSAWLLGSAVGAIIVSAVGLVVCTLA